MQLFRHAETEYNEYKGISGIDLNEAGKNRRYITTKYPIIFSSLANRAIATAGMIAEQNGGIVVPTPLLNPFSAGSNEDYIRLMMEQNGGFIYRWLKGECDNEAVHKPETIFKRKEEFLNLVKGIANVVVVTHREVLLSWFGVDVRKGEYIEI